MNDLGLCFEVFKGHVNHCVTFASEYLGNCLEIAVWFQKTTNRKWSMGNLMVTWPMTSR